MDSAKLDAWLQGKSDQDFEVISTAVKTERARRFPAPEHLSEKTLLILDALDTGLFPREVAVKFGVSRQYVYKVRKQRR